jgi:hypothetical protein
MNGSVFKKKNKDWLGQYPTREFILRIKMPL